MADISADQVKKLRDQTGAGMMDCKRALQEADGQMDRALDLLRERGLAAAAKKAGRVAAEGIVYSYIHGGGRVGVLLELNCETDFVAKTEDFRGIAHELALQVAAMRPQVVATTDISAETLEHERQVERARALQEGKPENRLDAIVEGRIKKYYEATVLLEQPYIRDDKKKVGELLKEAIARLGENVVVRRFVRWEVAESTDTPGEG